jgi:hypothetical protein
MISKFLKVSALALLLSASVSQSSKLQDGLYVGMSQGWNYITPNGHGIDSAAGAVVAEKKMDKYYSGFEGRVFAGYEDRWGDSSFVWGTELFAGFQNGDSGRIVTRTAAAIRGYTRINQEYGCGAKLKAGLGVTDTITLYAHASIVNTRFQVEHSLGDGGAGPAYAGSTHAKNLWGVAPGLGMKAALNKNWSLHGDAYYAIYQSFKKEIGGAAAGQQFDFKMNPKQLGISFGISYKISPSHN